MTTRRLGRTGLAVGELGIGTRGFVRKAFGGADARNVLSHAIERGIELIDAWSDPDVERAVGDVVRELRARDRAVVVTRVRPSGVAPPTNRDRLDRVFPVGAVQAQVEGSLRATRLDVLPVAVLQLWFDDWLDHAAWSELRGTLERLVHEGKALHWGVATAPGVPDTTLRAVAEPVFEVVVVEYSLFDRRADVGLLTAAKQHDTGVIVRAPLDQGALGGELAAGATFTPDDARASYFTGDRLAEVAVRLARLAEHVADPPAAARSTDPAREALERSTAARRGTAVEARTIAELALRFCVSHPAVSAAVAGMRTRDHVDANVVTADGRALSPELLERLAGHAWERDWQS